MTSIQSSSSISAENPEIKHDENECDDLSIDIELDASTYSMRLFRGFDLDSSGDQIVFYHPAEDCTLNVDLTEDESTEFHMKKDPNLSLYALVWYGGYADTHDYPQSIKDFITKVFLRWIAEPENDQHFVVNERKSPSPMGIIPEQEASPEFLGVNVIWNHDDVLPSGQMKFRVHGKVDVFDLNETENGEWRSKFQHEPNTGPFTEEYHEFITRVFQRISLGDLEVNDEKEKGITTIKVNEKRKCFKYTAIATIAVILIIVAAVLSAYFLNNHFSTPKLPESPEDESSDEELPDDELPHQNGSDEVERRGVAVIARAGTQPDSLKCFQGFDRHQLRDRMEPYDLMVLHLPKPFDKEVKVYLTNEERNEFYQIGDQTDYGNLHTSYWCHSLLDKGTYPRDLKAFIDKVFKRWYVMHFGTDPEGQNWDSGDEIAQVDDCSICFDSLENGKTLRKLQCQHSFHSGCIDRWLMTKRNCPICRATITR